MQRKKQGRKKRKTISRTASLNKAKTFPRGIVRRAFYSSGVTSARIGQWTNRLDKKKFINGTHDVLMAPSRFIQTCTGKIANPDDFIIVTFDSKPLPESLTKEKVKDFAGEFFRDLKEVSSNLGQAVKSAGGTLKIPTTSNINNVITQKQPLAQIQAIKPTNDQGVNLVELNHEKQQLVPQIPGTPNTSALPKRAASSLETQRGKTHSHASHSIEALPLQAANATAIALQTENNDSRNIDEALKPYKQLSANANQLKAKLSQLKEEVNMGLSMDKTVSAHIKNDTEQLRNRQEFIAQSLEKQLFAFKNIMTKKKEMLEGVSSDIKVEPSAIEIEFLKKASSNIKQLSQNMDALNQDFLKLFRDVQSIVEKNTGNPNPKIDQEFSKATQKK